MGVVYSGSIIERHFHVKSITQKPDHLQLYSNLHANSLQQEKQLWQICEKSVKYFSSYAPPKNRHFTPKIGLDRYVASIFYQLLQ